MRKALHQLGFHKTHHMQDVVADAVDQAPQWTRAIEGKYGQKTPITLADWDRLLGEFQAVVDIPSAMFGPELAEIYPDAKVIIQNRDPDSWYDSFEGSTNKVFATPPLLMRLQILSSLAFDPITRVRMRFHAAVAKHVLTFTHGEDKGKQKALKWYKDTYDNFRERIPAERRIEWNVRDGWEPLCKHLGVPVPMVRDDITGEMRKAPFPHVNDRESFKQGAIAMLRQDYQRALGNVYTTVGQVSLSITLGYGCLLLWRMTEKY